MHSADYPGVVGIRTYFIGGWNADGSPQWYRFTCTGTVVSPTKVLTVGHCATDTAFGTTYVIAGRDNLDDTSGGYVAGVATTWTDQNFNLKDLEAGTAPAPVHDVSVLTLKEPLPAQYAPVTLSAQGDQTPYADGTSADIVGYGINNTSTGASGTLFKATVTIRGDSTCGTVAGYDSTTMTCANSAPTYGVGVCNGDSGGPLLVGGVQVGITDWGTGECGGTGSIDFFERLSYYHDAIATDMARHGLVNLDWTGDGHSDLFTRDAYGYLRVYSGSGFVNDGSNGFADWAYLGTGGWNMYTKLFRVTNWNNDGTESVMARDPAGNLYQYKSDGAGAFVGGRVLVGTGWNSFVDIMVTNNWTGNGHPNVLGRTSNGDLYLYTSDLNGGWENGGIGIKIGNGWNSFNTVLTPGDWKGNGHQALIGRTPTGDLYLYQSDGHGGWMNGGIGIKIGNGWNSFAIFMSPGDWNGDDMVDLIGITPGGSMYLYTTDGHGNWTTGIGQLINSGWNMFNLVY